MTLADSPADPIDPVEPPPVDEAPEEQALTPPPPVERRNLLQIIVGVVIHPYSTFGWLREQGGASWLVPLGLVLALTLASRAVAIPIEQKQMADAIAQFQQQIDQAGGGKGGGNGNVQTFTVGGGPLGTANPDATASIVGNPANDVWFSYGMPLAEAFGGWALTTIILVVLTWLLGGRPSGGAMLRLSGWALVPVLVRLVVVLVATLVTQRIPATGLSRAFTPISNVAINSDGGDTTGSNTGSVGKPVIVTFGPGGVQNFQGPSFGEVFIQTLLSNLDLYTVWQLVLLAVGVAAIARLSWIKSGIATVVYWLLTLAIATLPVMLGPVLGRLLGGGGGPTFIGP